jgi:uncharacterized membrane protein
MYPLDKPNPELRSLNPSIAKQRYEAAKKQVLEKYRVRFGLGAAVGAVCGKAVYGNVGLAIGIGIAIGFGGYLMHLKIRASLRDKDSEGIVK